MHLETYDVEVLVVGAGIGGLCSAKTYLELAPDTELLLLESRKSVGGVWASELCYEGLKTNNLLGSYEFTDFPMDTSYGVKENSHIPGYVVHRYLTDYATHFDILQRIRFGTKVLEVEKYEDGWGVLAQRTGIDGALQQIRYKCKKLILSPGLASKPNPVKIPGQEAFERPIINHGSLTDEGPRLVKNPDIQHVTVVGASKTGYDTVHLLASQGKTVDWIVRESGGGATWMTPAWIPIGPFTVMLERLATMRFLTWFSPCIWGDFDGFTTIRGFLHRTWLGRFMVHHLWEKMRWDVVEGNGYRKDPTLAHLEPPESFFWSARVGILNYTTDIHQYLRTGQVKLHKKDISHLSKDGTVNFVGGEKLHTDALVAITGWSLVPSIKYKPDGIDVSLGVPSLTYSPEETAFWSFLDSKADQEILRQFPYLASPPKAKLPYTQRVTPFRLFRGIAPPGLTNRSERCLAFMKMVHSTSTMILAETQALWIFAYLNDRIQIDQQDVYWQTALTSRFGKLRYPWGFSAWYPEFVYDSIPYADMLLKDLGVRSRRKPNMLKEIFEPYTIHDYKGIKQEWKDMQTLTDKKMIK